MLVCLKRPRGVWRLNSAKFGRLPMGRGEKRDNKRGEGMQGIILIFVAFFIVLHIIVLFSNFLILNHQNKVFHPISINWKIFFCIKVMNNALRHIYVYC